MSKLWHLVCRQCPDREKLCADRETAEELAALHEYLTDHTTAYAAVEGYDV